ncbi:MAG: hypothetical protein H7A23_12565 [Leptospiraceae bacterium]|nr:hypothetical protein [Leptospiraceae bacterium]MCP5495382.1 hypothetical protein [Leptospiraceae bacterium]
MINKYFKIVLFIFIFNLRVFAVPVTPNSIESLLQDNKENFDFLNVVMSNLSPPRSKQIVSGESEKHSKMSFSNFITLFYEANERDIDGNSLYFMGKQKGSFDALKQTQKNFRDIFEYANKRYLDETKGLIRYASVKILRSKDKKAIKLLQEAYNELRRSENQYIFGRNIAPYLVRQKIEFYKKGINFARKSRKLILASLIEYKILAEDKPENNIQVPLLPKKFESDLIKENSLNEYEGIKFTLQSYIENRIISRYIPIIPPNTVMGAEKDPENKVETTNLDILEIHDDNFGIITYERDPILENSTKSLASDKGFEVEGLDSKKKSPPEVEGKEPIKEEKPANKGEPEKTNTESLKKENKEK